MIGLKMKIRIYRNTIYNPVYIDKAIKDYKELTNIKRYSILNSSICVFDSFKQDEILTIKEFSNYLIELQEQHNGI